jgi:iron complex outermembrane recepter protein
MAHFDGFYIKFILRGVEMVNRSASTRHWRTGWAALLAPCLLTVAGSALAAESVTLEEVLVTAQKRIENLQQVPISVAAITADMAEKIGVVSGQTLAQVVPGLMLNRQTNGTQAFLRGVGTSSTQAGNEPAVAMYVDDVYYGSSAVALTNYTSVQRIEVLKGPQGTLFGRNATGGVIQVFTQEPEAEPGVKVTLGYASFNTISGALYATGGLSDNVFANINLYSEDQRDGWGTNFTTGNPTYLQHNRGGRAKLQFNFGDSTRLMLSADYDDYFNQQAVYFRPAPGTFSAAFVSGVPVSIPPPGDYDTFEIIDPEASVKQYGGSAKLTHDFGTMEFKSVSAYRHAKAIQRFAQDGSSIFRQIPKLQYNTKTISQEFQLLSGADSKWQWVGGVFFLKDESTVDPFTFVGSGAGGTPPNFLTALGLTSDQDLDSYSGFFQATIPMTDRSNVTAGVRYTNDKRSIRGGRINTNAAGVQTPFVAAVNDGLGKSWASTTGRLSFDYRFTDDIMGYVAYNKGFKSGLFNSVLAPGPTSALTGSPAAPTHDPAVDPENIDAYTIGLKSEFLDNRLRFNAEAFLYKYEGLQMQQVVAVPGSILTTTRLTNVAAATIKGFDFDVTYKPMERLTLGLNGQVMDGEYDDFPNGQYFITNPAGGNCAFVVAAAPAAVPCNAAALGALPPNYNPVTGTWNLKGNKTVQTPPFTANLTATYDVPVSTGDLAFTLHYSHTGNYWAEPSNGQGQVSPPGAGFVSRSNKFNEKQHTVGILNASVLWSSTDDSYSVRLWGKNLVDDRYWSFNNSTGSITKQVPAAPRTYGLTLSANF